MRFNLEVAKTLDGVDWLAMLTKGGFLVRIQDVDDHSEQIAYIVSVNKKSQTVWDPASQRVCVKKHIQRI